MGLIQQGTIYSLQTPASLAQWFLRRCHLICSVHVQDLGQLPRPQEHLWRNKTLALFYRWEDRGLQRVPELGSSVARAPGREAQNVRSYSKEHLTYW